MNSFIENVNYVANLDNKYGRNIELFKNNISLRTENYDVKIKFTYYNYQTSELIDILATYNAVSISGFESIINNFKSQINALLGGNKFICTSTFSYTNFVINNVATVDIKINSLDDMIKTYGLNITITSGSNELYNINGIVNDTLKILPSIALFDSKSLIGIKEINNNIVGLNLISSNINEILLANDSAISANENAIIALNSKTSAIASASTATTKASEALTSATSATASATTATTKATEASSSAASALSSKNTAAISETNALASKNSASTSETNALASKNAAATSATNAAASETNALAYKNAASTSATSASVSATTATTKASDASTSATSAATSATASSNSATASATSATNASASATSAANSAISASTSATNASASSSTATIQATNAATSATSASNSAISATASATTATTKASEASTSATNAASSATASANSATNSATSATASATSATNSANSATAAAASAATAASIAGGNISLDNLNNVTAPTPANGDILSYVTATTDWRPLSILPVAKGGTGVTASTGSGNVVLSNSPTLVTPILGVATGTSFNGITGLSSQTPIDNGTAAVGTATTAARADHVHASSGPVVASGGYIPTVSISAGGTLSGNSTKFMYTRIGNVVTVSGRISITFSSIGTEVVGTITVPITMSTVGGSDTAHGIITKNQDGSGIITGKSLSTSEVSFSIIPNNLNQSSCRFIFTYQLSSI